VTLCGLVFLGGLVVAAFLIDTGRVRALESLARGLGLEFHEHGYRSFQLPGGFVLARAGISRAKGQARRILEGEIEGVRAWLFELRHVEDPDKGRTRGYPVGVAMFEVPGVELPQFVLRPRGVRQRLAVSLGGQDIVFTGTPRFSSLYRLEAQDEGAARSAFTWNVRQALEQRPGLVVQGTAGKLLCLRPPRMLRWTAFRAKSARKLLEDGMAVARALAGDRAP
jgi:hypothetical protein